MQSAGAKVNVEKWDSDSDSDETDDEDLMGEPRRVGVCSGYEYSTPFFTSFWIRWIRIFHVGSCSTPAGCPPPVPSVRTLWSLVCAQRRLHGRR
eukprot:524567-Prymnesium_polylepis.1